MYMGPHGSSYYRDRVGFGIHGLIQGPVQRKCKGTTAGRMMFLLKASRCVPGPLDAQS